MRVPIAVRFFGIVDDKSVVALMNVIDGKIRQGYRDFILLISTPGGNVNSGLTAYNYLKGLPINLTTHNIGVIDSIGLAIYSAGSTRLSSPNARFLIHGVSLNVNGSVSFTDKQLKEKMDSLKVDIENIANVMASTIGIDVGEVKKMMDGSRVLSPYEAKEMGLVTGITPKMFNEGTEVVSIDSLANPV